MSIQRKFGLTYWIILLIFLVSTYSCKTTIQTVKPIEIVENRTSFERKVSLLNVPIKTSVKDLEKQINKYLIGELYRDDSFSDNDGDNLKCIVKKYDDIKFTASNNSLKLSLPLAISGTYRKLGVNVNFSGTLKAKYTTSIKLEDNYQLVTKTKSNGYTWVKQPNVRVAGLDFPVGWIVDLVLHTQGDYVNNSIDRAIKDNLNLKELLKPGIEALCEPVNVSETYKTWFQITPIELYASQVSTSNDTINFTVGLKAYTETLLGEKPTVKTFIDSIPFRVADKIEDDFNIGVVAVLSHDEVSSIMKTEYVDSKYKYEQGKHVIQFTKMSVFSQEEDLIIEVGMIGSIVGDIYLRGKPVYDKESRSIVMQGLEFDFDTEQKLLKTADWLVHGPLKRIMKKYMIFPIGAELDAVKKESEVYLTNYEPVKGVLINGDLKEVETSELYLIEDAIIIVVGVNGKLNVQITGGE